VHTGFWRAEKPGKETTRRLGLDRRIILKWGFELKYNIYIYIISHTQLYVLLDYIRL